VSQAGEQIARILLSDTHQSNDHTPRATIVMAAADNYFRCVVNHLLRTAQARGAVGTVLAA